VNVKECINSRRSVRSYTDELIPDEVINELLVFGTKAATGSNAQPWGFVVIKDKEVIQAMSDEIKLQIHDNLDEYPYFRQYESWLTNPKFNVFNRANCIMLIYGDTTSHWYDKDCSLAAANIILAAQDMGIGTCWIGFAERYCNTQEFKAKHEVPENYDLVSALSMGYMKMQMTPPERKEPVVFYNK
jgi:nitroreductase